jgi:hypothetical protein
MAGWIFVDKEKDGGEMRQQMRRSMRGGYRYDGTTPMMHEDKWEHGYRMGYKHGWEDSEDDEMEMRRTRDNRGRYM